MIKGCPYLIEKLLRLVIRIENIGEVNNLLHALLFSQDDMVMKNGKQKSSVLLPKVVRRYGILLSDLSCVFTSLRRK